MPSVSSWAERSWVHPQASQSAHYPQTRLSAVLQGQTLRPRAVRQRMFCFRSQATRQTRSLRKACAPDCKTFCSRRNLLGFAKRAVRAFSFRPGLKSFVRMQRDDRKKSMLKFVQDVQPIIVEQFAEHTPAQVSFLCNKQQRTLPM